MSVQNEGTRELFPVTRRPDPPPEQGWAAVYRLYGASGDLLYVGSTGDPSTRWRRHKGDKPWWSDVADYALEWWPTRQQAYAEEWKAIGSERPTHNERGLHSVGLPVVRETAARFADLLEQVEAIKDPEERAVVVSQVMHHLTAQMPRLKDGRQEGVLLMRKQGVPYRVIATRLGVSVARVQQIEVGETSHARSRRYATPTE